MNDVHQSSPQAVRRLRLFAVIVFTIFVAPAVAAQESTSKYLACEIAIPPADRFGQPPAANVIRADTINLREGNTSELVGNAYVNLNGTQIRSQRVTVNQATQSVSLASDFTAQLQNLFVSASAADIDAANERYAINEATYVIADPPARGSAARLAKADDRTTVLERATYTTCGDARPAWHLAARKITLDSTARTVATRGMMLRLGRVPVFYLPYFKFPDLEAEPEGLQLPEVDQNSETGWTIGLPYVVKAANANIRVTPQTMTRRGYGLLTDIEHSSWLASLSWIPKDRQFNGEFSREYFDTNVRSGAFKPATRWSINFSHSDRTSPWYRTVKYQNVSDVSYFRDFDFDIQHGSRLATESVLAFGRQGGTYRIGFIAQRFDSTVRDGVGVVRLPELEAVWQPTWHGFEFDSRANFARYEDLARDAPNNEYQRVHGSQSVRWRMRSSWGELAARLQEESTQFEFTEADVRRTDSTRRISTRSLFGAAYFDRLRERKQQLVPKFFYIRRDSDARNRLPHFDTGPRVFQTAQLFAENRHPGLDQVKDADRLAVGFSHRIFSLTGIPVWHADFGLVRHFEALTLNGKPETHVGLSLHIPARRNVVLQHHQRWSQSGFGDESHTTLTMRNGSARILGLAYSLRPQPELDQASASFYLPTRDKRWYLAGRWSYDLARDAPIERFLGVGYDGCCLNVQFMYRSYIKPERYPDFVRAKEHQGFVVRVTLKGLLAVGREVESILERGIPGFLGT